MSRMLPVRIGDIKEQLGCLRLFYEDPARIFASPFVRPEDVPRLEGVVDSCKLCGRTRGPIELSEVVGAYFAGAYQGNLLWLLDTLERLAGRFRIDNAAIPASYFDLTDGCTRRCKECGVCAQLAADLVRDQSPTLSKMREQ